MGKYRMYSCVLSQLNPIQKGIQSAHSIVEFATRYHKLTEYLEWSIVDKTIIMLNGGTYQEMKEDREFLKKMGVPYDVFHEPDLCGIVTSYSFILEDKVWDTKKYPSEEDYDVPDYDASDAPIWLQEMGGIKNLQLRNFLKSKRLAN